MEWVHERPESKNTINPRRASSDGHACNWWLRSVYASFTSSFCYVGTDVSAGYIGAYISYGFAPGFKVA